MAVNEPGKIKEKLALHLERLQFGMPEIKGLG
jgi:hypothetical protein